MKINAITPENNRALAELIRDSLKKHALDIPGTVYFDDNLNHLSDYYLADFKKRFYFVISDDNDKLIGGIGIAECDVLEDCCEMQKLYISDEAQGSGLSYYLIALIETKAKELGYKRMYLETHDNLAAAIHVYEKCGFREIEKPEKAIHSTMTRFFVKEIV